MSTLKYILLEKDCQLFLYDPTCNNILPNQMSSMVRDGYTFYFVVSDGTRYFTTPILTQYLNKGWINPSQTNWGQVLTVLSENGQWPIEYNENYLTHHIPIPPWVRTPVTIGNNRYGVKLEPMMEFPEYITPRVIGCDHSDNVTVHYGGEVSSYPVTRPFWKYHRDLVFSSALLSEGLLSFNNTIPVCGGSAYFPVVKDDSLYAKDAVFALYPSYKRNLNNLLIDFTPIGGCVPIKFSDCSVELVNDWVVITLPNEVITSNRQIITSIYGKLFLGHKFIRRPSDKIIMIPISFLKSLAISLDQLRSTEQTVKGTMAVESTLISNAIVQKLTSSFNNFFIVTNAKFLYENELVETCKISPTIRKFPYRARGLLRNSTTRSISDYVRLDYVSDTTVITHSERSLLIPEGQSLDHDMQRVGFLHNRNDRRCLKDYTQDMWTLFEWMTTEELLHHES